jgi:hypothetical protein
MIHFKGALLDKFFKITVNYLLAVTNGILEKF